VGPFFAADGDRAGAQEPQGDLAVRPVFHQLEARIEAHVFIAFLAYCLHVTLARRLHALAPGLTSRSVLEKFAAVQVIDVYLPTTDGRELVLTRYTEPEAELRLLCRNSSWSCPRNYPRESPPHLEPAFHSDSYGYKLDRSAIDAVRQTRQRCWRYDWVLDIDVKCYFDSIDWELLLKAVCHHTNCAWVLLDIGGKASGSDPDPCAAGRQTYIIGISIGIRRSGPADSR
jgi:hypothetical protein